MLNKTIRSVLSLALVFCLVLGMSGNAIALAVSNPVDGALGQVDTKVYGTIDELNAMIDDLEDQIDTLEATLLEGEEKLAEGKQKLEEAKQKLAEVEAGDLKDANDKLADAQQKLVDAKAMLEGEKLAELRQTAYEQAFEQFSKMVADAEADAWKQFEEAVGQEYKTQSEKLQKALDDAKVDLNKKIADKKAELNQTLADKKAEMETEIADKQTELDQKIADEQAKLDQKIADEKAKLDEKLALAGADQAAIDSAYAEFNAEAEKAQAEFDAEAAKAQAEFDAKAAEARTKYDDAKAEAEQKAADAEADAWKAYDEKCEEAWATFNEEAGAAAAEAREEVKKKIDDAKAEAKVEFEKKFEEEFNKKLEEAHQTLADAEVELKKVEEYVGNINEAVAGYHETIAEAEAVIAEAELMIADAKAAIAKARETIEQARTLVNNVEKTYTDLRVAIANPQPSLTYIRETVADLQANYNAAWEALLELDKDIDELITAYEALAQYEIGAISVEPFYQAEVKINEIKMEVNGTVYGVDAMTLPEVSVNYEFSFEGIAVPELPETVATLDTTLDNIIAKGVTLNAALDYYVAAAKPVLAKALDVTEEALGFTYNALKNNLNKEGAVKVYNWLYNNPDKVCNLVKKFGVFGLDLMFKFGPYALDLLEEHSDLAVLGMKVTAGGAYLTATLGAAVLGYAGDHLAFLADYDDEVKAVARKLYAKYGDEAKALVEVYVDYLNLRERYYNATHADYTIFHDSLFVAIGDSATAVSGSYVDELAELLEIPHMTENLGELDLTVEEAINLVKDNADLIGKADLITLNFTNIAASVEMLSALVEDYDHDFTDAVNNTVDKGINKALAELKERMVAYGIGENHIDLVDRAGELVDRALAELNDRLIAEGMDEATVNMVLAATEAYAVAYITRAAWYPALVDAVYEINPDAQIVIVGTYNDLDGVSVEVGNRNIEIGELARGLIAVANLENLTQAFIGDEAIYVHASAVETVFESSNYENLNNLGVLMSIMNDEMLPSEAGHAYIAEEIFEALNVEYKIWGDVNGDRKVNCRDARLILQYRAGLITENDLDLTWADVNGDGSVNSRDARLILQLRAGLIEHFPVCRLYEE